MSPTTDTARDDKQRWNEKYGTHTHASGTEPVPFLREHIELLPTGTALDLAMGGGRNGVYLATQGFEVTGLDISEEGLKRAQALAARRGITLRAAVVDLERYRLPIARYDLIVCTYYLQRDLLRGFEQALKPGGMAVIETYTLEYAKYRPQFPRAYLLQPNELLRLFEGMRILRYQDRDDGHSAYASVLVQKPRAGTPQHESARGDTEQIR